VAGTFSPPSLSLSLPPGTDAYLYKTTAAAAATTTTTTIVLRPSVWDYPGEPVPEETFTHPPS